MFELGIYCRCVNDLNVLYGPLGSIEVVKWSCFGEDRVWLVANCFRVLLFK